MNNNLMMLLPFLMNMNKTSGDGNGGSNMTELMLNLLKNPTDSGAMGNSGINPMMLMLIGMMGGKNNAAKPEKPTNSANSENNRTASPTFEEIKSFSGSDVMEALKILMQNR